MTTFRPHALGLTVYEAMEAATEVDSIASLLMILKPGWERYPGFENIAEDRIVMEPYGYDARIGWDTYVVMLDNMPVGFTDGPLT